jgi:Skp family chaperone for outer membrane proteins
MQTRTILIAALIVTAVFPSVFSVEIPLEALSPARIGYVDLQKVFDSYPEKSFAEGDLLREIEKRKRELGQRQGLINTLRQQIASDESALQEGKRGGAVIVPVNNVPDLTPAPVAQAAPTPSTSTTQAPAKVDPYPLEDPLAGLPGHDASAVVERLDKGPTTQLPGMKQEGKKGGLLDQLATGSPVSMSSDAQMALQKRIDDNKKLLDRKTAEFREFRGLAVADMKTLQNQKTYGVMSKIYAVLQILARDEGVTVVLDKAYVLYGEDTVDLSDRLIARLAITESE